MEIKDPIKNRKYFPRFLFSKYTTAPRDCIQQNTELDRTMEGPKALSMMEVGGWTMVGRAATDVVYEVSRKAIQSRESRGVGFANHAMALGRIAIYNFSN